MSVKKETKSKGINSSRGKETDLVKAKGKDLVNVQEIYENVLEDCRSSITELWKEAQVLTIKANFFLGESISVGTTHIKVTDLVERLSKDLKMSTRKLWYALKFFELFKDWAAVEKILESNTTWPDMIAEYLTEGGEASKKKKVDGAHIKLVDDIKEILDKARKFEYHDEYTEHESPKAVLKGDLNSVIANLKRGDYVND